MNINWKKIVILIGFLLTIIMLGYLLYYFLLKPSASQIPVGNQNINATGGLPNANTNVNIPINSTTGLLPQGTDNQQNINQTTGQPASAASIANGGKTITNALTTSPTSGLTLANNKNGLLYYEKNSGLFYRIDQSGQITPLSSQIFYDVSQVTWSPNKNEAILEYPDGSNILYNFATNKQTTLPAHWKDFNFSPSGSQIVFKSIGDSVDNRWLAVAKADGSSAVKIESLGDKDKTVYPSWSPNNQMVAMFSEDRNVDQQTLYFVGLNKENFKSLTIQGRDFRNVWSPNGDRLLYSVYNSQNDGKPNLFIATTQADTIGQVNKSLQISTWADKCTFADNNIVYCAVPQRLDEGAGIFPNDLDNSPTDLYKIDLNSGTKNLIATPDKNQNAQNLVVDANQQFLYFTSKTDGNIYQIRLK
ncbi:MAG: PD40 domain-containing protein [Candidatus Buchananbacteria bacterium]|nr:PD40 domain-containing protein [Candidatus Buchananbacteria bacterium]